MVIDEIVEKRKETYRDIIKKYPIEGFPIFRENSNRFLELFKSGFVNILQCKKTSPKGGERLDYNYTEMAKIFEAAGGSCISIYTEPFYYNGSDEHLINIKKNTKLPLLRLDFIFDEYQIYESKMIGADAIELISSIISYDELRYFLNISQRIGLGTVVVCKNEDEIKRAISAGAKVLGVTTKNAINIALEYVKNAKNKGVELYLLLMTDNGIRSLNDIKKTKQLGFDGMIVGEYLFKSKNPIKLAKEIIES